MAMANEFQISARAGLMDCNVCLTEIPRSVAKSLEGPDYVFFYFGPACYAQWCETIDASPTAVEN